MRERFAIFVHGCFWHRHPGCRHATFPKTNVAFWSSKFTANIERDRMKLQALRTRSFRVLVVWECETRNEAALATILDHFFNEPPRAPATK